MSKSFDPNRKKIKLPPAVGVCRQCLTNPLTAKSNGRLIAVYCGHHQAGAYIDLNNGSPQAIWNILTPVTEEQWGFIINRTVEIISQTAEKKPIFN